MPDVQLVTTGLTERTVSRLLKTKRELNGPPGWVRR
jgi:hypothetical protein